MVVFCFKLALHKQEAEPISRSIGLHSHCNLLSFSFHKGFFISSSPLLLFLKLRKLHRPRVSEQHIFKLRPSFSITGRAASVVQLQSVAVSYTARDREAGREGVHESSGASRFCNHRGGLTLYVGATEVRAEPKFTVLR